MPSELEALRELLDGGAPAPAPAPAPAARDGVSPTRISGPPDDGPLDVDALMRRFDLRASSPPPSPGPPPEPSASSPPPPSPAEKIARALESYDRGVAGAEANVERLGAVMDDAERALDEAILRNRRLDAAADARRGAEMGELGRVLEAKERAVDSLRETLAETRRTLERRIEELEERLDAAIADARDADRARRAAETRLAEVLLRGEEEKAEAKAREEAEAKRAEEMEATREEEDAEEGERRARWEAEAAAAAKAKAEAEAEAEAREEALAAKLRSESIRPPRGGAEEAR